MKSNVCNGRAKRLVQLQNLGIWGQFFVPNVLDYPHLPLKCKIFIICTWTKMTCKYLLDLRKDIIIMVGNSAKISPIYFCGEISSYMKILPILPHLDPHPIALPADRWPPGQDAICSLQVFITPPPIHVILKLFHLLSVLLSFCIKNEHTC